jgi:hypothetical protein
MFHNVKQPNDEQARPSTLDAADPAPTCPICDARLMVFVTILGELEVWQCRPCGATLLIPNRSAALRPSVQSH